MAKDVKVAWAAAGASNILKVFTGVFELLLQRERFALIRIINLKNTYVLDRIKNNN